MHQFIIVKNLVIMYAVIYDELKIFNEVLLTQEQLSKYALLNIHEAATRCHCLKNLWAESLDTSMFVEKNVPCFCDCYPHKSSYCRSHYVQSHA